MAPRRLFKRLQKAPWFHAEGIADEVSVRWLNSSADASLRRWRLATRGTCPIDARPGRRCGISPPDPIWNGWSPDATNARFHRASGLPASDVPRLTLKWAFGFPGVSSVYGQPTVAGGRVFVGVDTGYVYALDAASGCVHWLPGRDRRAQCDRHRLRLRQGYSGQPGSAEVSAGGRIGEPVGAWRLTSATFAAMCTGGCEHGRVFWELNVDPHPLAAITDSPTCTKASYVPVSTAKRLQVAGLNYPCCTFRGSIVALDAATGRQLWRRYAIANLKAGETQTTGDELWTGAGAAIWHAPTIDPRNRAIYVATGDA